MNLIDNVRDVSRIGYGFMASKALFAALDLDLFTRLEHAPQSVQALAAAAGVPQTRLQMLLSALRGLGLIGRDDKERAFNSPAASKFLARSSPHYYGDYFRFQIDRLLYPHWDHLLPAMRGERFTPFYEQLDDPQDAHDFSVAQHGGSLGAARLLARRLGRVRWRRLLDVAGGTGAFSITLCADHPELRATILDFAPVCKIATSHIAQAGLAHRISLIEGDARSTVWPKRQDAVLMSYLLSAVSEPDITALLRRSFESLAPGGAMVLHDFMVTDDLGGPVSAALWQLSSAIADPEAAQLTPSMLIASARSIGFVDAQEFELLPGITRVVVAHKPGGSQ
jgi:ubiquinone/menaquinone biosynthesis C-methylase UbiE